MEEGILSQWKCDVQSKDKSVQIDRLKDIVTELHEWNEKDYVKVINSDLSYFLSEMLIYQHRISSSLVIKIICHLSEVKEFFKNDFFRCIRSSLRLINSFSPDCVSDNSLEEAHYKKNILAFNTIMLQRAQIFKVNFKDERIPKVSLVITASSLTSLDSRIIEKLEFVNTSLDIFRLMQTSFDDKIYQEKKITEILTNLNFSKKDLLDVDYFVLVARLFHSIINFLPATNEADDEILVRSISEKFIILIRFVLDEIRDLPATSYMIFLNLFYYIFTSIVFINVHQMLLNYFLTLNGLNFLIFIVNSQDSNKILKFKARAVISEVMLHISKILLEVDDDDIDNLAQLRQKYLKIILKSDIDPEDLRMEKCSEVSRESMLFTIFKYYVLLKWSKIKPCKGKMMSTMAFIIESFRENKIVMDKGVASMMFYIYTTNFVNITGSALVENSSAILMKFVGIVNIIVDYNFLKWWFIHNSKNRGTYEKLFTYLLSPKSIEEFKNIHENDLFAIDIKFLMKMFVNDKTPVEHLEKVTRLLCRVFLNLHDIGKIQTFYENQRTDQDRRRSIYALKILCASRNKKLSLIRQNKTHDLANKTLETSTDMHERLLAVQLLVKLSKIVVHNKMKK
ncbi:unnamed protein product [Chironomus riparius]|uniref:Uncharacterized protein n=1 Tax=Chironomus riparius TaxID=315576 RepID=A0A9N9S3G9_9DIPT|nr:unnamed protein product [Chironomus riparius]